MNREENEVQSVETSAAESTDDSVSQPRREAVAKLAYASPLVVGMLFSKRAAAQFTPPAPPMG